MANVVAELDRGREAYAGQAWSEAFESLSAADRGEPLGPDDLELLATAAYMIGREADFLATLERAYRANLDAGDQPAALRCAFWVGINLARAGEMGRAGGWLGRAQRLLDSEGGDRVERGYLLLPRMFEQEASGDWEAAVATAAEAAAIGERLGDPDLFALAAHEQGHVLILNGRLREGLRLLDEAMVAVTAEELSPIVSGIVYCGVILACQDAFEVRRAQEWTAALSTWCERQPDLVAFTGRCMVHRAEIMQLHGTWADALEEARRAADRALEGENPAAAGEACYREGELHRLAGDHDAAERAYREASERGREPQPGFALLRLAQGRGDAARATIRRVEAETTVVAKRLGLLPAYVEIMLADGDLDAARDASRELESLARGHEGDASGALVALRRAGEVWQELAAPYEAARARELVGLACRALGDEDAAALELGSARAAFASLGAKTDLARLDSRTAGAPRDAEHGLTDRELEVLRHLAGGATNKAIAAELVLSVRTVDRHVSNIFAKLGVSSRAAATAYAHEHDLV